MYYNLKILKYLLTGLTIISFIAVISLFFFSNLFFPHKIPKSDTFVSETSIDWNLINVGDKEDPLTKKLTVSELASFFKKPLQSVQPTASKEVPLKPELLPVYDKKRFEYLGFAEQEGNKVFLFKDTLYNDVIRITEDIATEGFNLVSVNDDSFIISKEEDLFWIKR